MTEKKSGKKSAGKKNTVKKPAVKKAASKKPVTKKAKKAATTKSTKKTNESPEKTVKTQSADSGQVELVGMQEVAAMLRIPMLQLRKLVQSGKIPAVKLDGEWRFNKDLVYAAYHKRSTGR